MAMSIGELNAYSMYQTKPMNMALSNEAPVSDVYSKRKAVGDISTVSPVVYPNAQKMKVGEVGNTETQDESLKVSKQFNKIADKFQGTTTGYGRAMESLSYAQVGGSFDAFA